MELSCDICEEETDKWADSYKYSQSSLDVNEKNRGTANVNLC